MASFIDEDDEGEFLTGRLLVAMPGIEDPRFERTVLYLCAHDEDQAMGLAVNRPVDGLTVYELLERLGVNPTSRRPAIWSCWAGRSSASGASSYTPTTSIHRTRPCPWPTAWA